MSATDHPAYNIEKERLDYTVEYIEKTINATDEYKKLYKENIKDAMVNLDYLDSSQSYISVLINTKFMEMAERNYDHLVRSRKKPYFARIDYKQNDSSHTDKIYIGKMSLSRAEDDIPLIVDWRSPIANVYYEGRLGEVSYETETGVEKGEMSLKRQFTIEDGKLENIIDIDITTTDTFLQASLDAHAEKRLKDIASTIQGEQNKVIRADMNRPLIVQGVAGSGKTTIALHRIAYFIYTYEETFDPDNFLILAPNRLFINYISEVLPELGVEKVKQTTFIDFMKEIIKIKHNLVNPDEKLLYFIHSKKDSKTNKMIELTKWTTSFKGSLYFKDIIDNYIEYLADSFVPEEDFQLEDHTFFTVKEIKRLFIEEYSYLPLYKRIAEIKKSLYNKIKNSKKQFLQDLEEKYDKQIDNIRENMDETEERRNKIVPLIDERDQKLQSMKNSFKTIVNKYVSKFPKKDLLYYYNELITNVDNIKTFSNEDFDTEKLAYLCSYSKKLLDNKKIELEDLAPLAYLKHKVFGFEKEITINSVVIDEAQDFSVFQFYALKNILKTEMFTLLGDLSQGIHSYRAITDWDQVLENVFNKSKSNYMTLEQSYRTTIEIMDLANQVIKQYKNPNIVLAKPVIRHGKKPIFKALESTQELLENIKEQTLALKKEDFKSIAVICKTDNECLKVKKHFDKNKMQTHLLKGEDSSYDAGIVIVPSYLAKGLEFDAVLIVTMEEHYSEDELDIKLLYVALTRPMHRLYIYCKKGTMPLLERIGTGFFDI